MKDFSASIQEHSATLRSRHPAVRECRVNIEDRPPHLYECRRYNVRVEFEIGGHQIVINREHEDDPAIALADAFAAAHRQLDTLQA
jgi:hypothetical protein